MADVKVKVYGSAKGQTARAIVQAYLMLHPDATFAELSMAFPASLGPIKTRESLFYDVDTFEHFTKTADGVETDWWVFKKKEEFFSTSDGHTLTMDSNWKEDNFEAIVSRAKEHGIVAEVDKDKVENGQKCKIEMVGAAGAVFTVSCADEIPEDARAEGNVFSVIIPEGVEAVKESAFSGCEGLTSVTFPSSVKRIDNYAFDGCKSLKRIVLPQGVGSVGRYAFSGCSNVEFIQFPKTLVSIEKFAFFGVQLAKVSVDCKWGGLFPSGVFTQGDPFEREVTPEPDSSSCEAAEFVDLGLSVLWAKCNVGAEEESECGSYYAWGETKAKDRYSEDNYEEANREDVANLVYGGEARTPSSREFEELSNECEWEWATIGNRNGFRVTGPNGNSIFLPACGSKVDEEHNVDNEVGVYWSETCGSWGDAECLMFDEEGANVESEIQTSGCSIRAVMPNLNYYVDPRSTSTSLIIKEGVAEIPGGVFQGNAMLENVTLPSTLENICDYAFADCSSLSSVSILDGVTKIGKCAFYGCSSLICVKIPQGVSKVGDHVFHGCSSLSSVSIPESVTSIGESAFEGCESLTSVTIPNTVKSIGERAFRSCDSLTSIAISERVCRICEGAFEWCKSLTSVAIPNSVTRICRSAFYGCSSLTSVTIPESVTEIGSEAFLECDSLANVSIQNKNCEFETSGSWRSFPEETEVKIG